MTATEGDLRAVDVAWEEVKRCTSNKSSEPPHSRRKLLNGPMGYVSRPKVGLNDVHVDRQQNPKANIGSVDVGVVKELSQSHLLTSKATGGLSR